MADIQDFYRGDTRKYKVIVRNKDTGAPISVNGGKLTVTFKSTKTKPDNEAEIQVSVDAVDDDANPTGEILITLSSTDTDVKPALYYYDFQYQNASGEVTTILPGVNDTGKVRIHHDITRTTL